MIYERGKLRYAICFCVLALLLQYSLALPVMETSRAALARLDRRQPNQQRGRQCLTVQANPDSIQPTPEHIAEVLGPRQVENFLLSLPLEGRTDQQTRTGRGRNGIGEGAKTVLCRGVWPFPPKAVTEPRHVRAVYFMEWQNERRERQAVHELYLLLSPEFAHEMMLKGNISVSLTCTNSEVYCFDIHYKDLTLRAASQHRLLRRNADHATKRYKSHDSPTNQHTASPVLAVGAAVVSLIVLVGLVALCAGTSTYKPKRKDGVTLQKSGSEAPPPSSEVTVQFQSSQPVHVEVETRSEAAATNGGMNTTNEGRKSSPKSRDSLERQASPQSQEDKDRENRARTLSARSFDPLPAIPNLDTAEDGGQRSKNSPPAGREVGGIDDEDDEAGYAYARVGGAAVEAADSDKEDKIDNASGGQSSGLPPYGKVSHHVTKAKVTETEEYAEVKEVFRGPLAASATSRGRSATDPIDPLEAGADSLREKRALTHTHMMPLPAVPRPQESIDDSEMYDSIPDDMRNSQVPLPQQASTAATTKPRPKERLYESMDDMEDTYESVPDNLKPDSPVPMSPATPKTSPSKAPLLSPSISPPMPPSSPVPKTTAKEPEKKALEKTLSAAQAEQEGDGKRRFSFFGRKKTASVSGVGSRKERDKHKDQKGHKDHKDHKDHKETKDHKEHHHVPHQPLPDVPAQPPVMSPPLPPIPNQDDEDDTTYDTPQLDFMAGPAGLSPISSPMSPVAPLGMLDAKARTQSLPSSARGAGASMFHSRANVPLPRVPEDSGQGLVLRERVLESPVGGEEEEKPYDSVKVLPDGEKPYDTVKVLDEGENIDEPNYDTVHPEDIFRAILEDDNNEADPGYDRIKQLREEANLEEGGGGGEEAEGSAAPKEGEGAGIRYGKVVRPTSPEDDKIGIVPEHDEEGYAVVPEDFKMRKRALSASKGSVTPQVKLETSEAGYNSINEVEEVTTTTSTDEPVEPSEPYATVNIIAKKKPVDVIEPVEPSEPYATVDIIAKKEKKTDELTSEQERPRSMSPIPPPLPPVGDLGDIEEFSQPPIPIQSEGILELIPGDDERGSPSSLKPPGSDEPPYAKVKSKDHPYAELDLGDVREMAKLITPDDTNDAEATYDEVSAETTKSAAALKDTALGYDTVADQDTLEEEDGLGYHTVSSTDTNRKTKQEQSSGYDTVVDSDGGRGENGASTRSQVELETPKLEPAEPQQLYDSLEPVTKEDEGGKEEEPAGNFYYTLEAEQAQNGVSPEDVEEEQYEEIDEDRRMHLIEKQKQLSQGKLN